MKLILEISPRWRLVEDGAQWIIQVKKGTPTVKSTGWRSVEFFVTKSDLVRALRDTVGAPFPSALTEWLERAPEQYQRVPSDAPSRSAGPSRPREALTAICEERRQRTGLRVSRGLSVP